MNRTIHFFQPQFATKNDDGCLIYWLPYSAGCLWAYLTQFNDVTDQITLGGLHYRRSDIEQVVSNLNNVTICAFSVYVWNEQYCLKLAQHIKKAYPDCLIVFGGPQTNSGYLAYDFIDSLVFSEGEENILEIIRTVLQGKKPDKFYAKKRLENLDIPSPYLLGLFDQLIIDAGPNVKWQTVIETNRGCPYACTFCDWGSLTYTKVKKFDLGKIDQELVWISSRPVVSIALGDANFGIFRERDRAIATLFKERLKDSQVDYVNLSYAKNSHETVFEIAKILGSLTKSVTLSMQSMNPDTLKAIKRSNLKTNELSQMLEMSRRYNIPTHTEMILGLPEETFASWTQGLCDLLELGQHNWIDVYFASVLENSEMNLLQKKSYDLKTVKATNYLLGSHGDDTGIVENNEIVCETNTMSRSDMCRSYMYTWMIQNFHLTGYSQILARYVRYAMETPYRQFYDYMFKTIQNDKSPVGAHYRAVENMCKEILLDGSIGDNQVEIHQFFGMSTPILYPLISDIMNIVEKVTENFGPVDSSVLSLQKQFVINPEFPATNLITLNYEIDCWKPIVRQYRLVSHLPKKEISVEEMIRYRRRGWMKHDIQPVDMDSDAGV